MPLGGRGGSGTAKKFQRGGQRAVNGALAPLNGAVNGAPNGAVRPVEKRALL